MGCHTRFSVPLNVSKEEIIQKAKEYLDSDDSKWMSDSTKQMYRYAVEHMIFNMNKIDIPYSWEE